MEYIDRIFYRKINPSDFKKLYDLDRPTGGNGQTYIEAAGIAGDKIVDFLSKAERNDGTITGDTRFVYKFRAYVLGNSNADILEFAPRSGRINYKISRQTMRDKHPAWDVTNGFPEPNRDATGNYTSAGDFVGIIDDLVIFIIRTTYNKYYAGYVNLPTMPTTWPSGIGLEDMFLGARRGIITVADKTVEFVNDLANPFGTVRSVSISFKTNYSCEKARNRIFFGAPGTSKSFTLNKEKDALINTNRDGYERVTFHADYSYSQFVGAYKPVNDNSGNIGYRFVPGPFVRLLVKAYQNIVEATDPATGVVDVSLVKPYVLVIEEINRAKVSAVFGEVFQLLDRNNEHISEYDVQPSEELKQYMSDKLGLSEQTFDEIKIPDNLFIWATMNSADQGVFPMDTAFKRRWSFEYIKVDEKENDESGNTNVPGVFAVAGTVIEWNALRKAINDLLSSSDVKAHEDKLIGPFFIKSKNYVDEATNNLHADFVKVIESKVLMYVFEDAAKTKRDRVFVGKANTNRFSTLCEAFEEKGIEIFAKIDGVDFIDRYNSYCTTPNTYTRATATVVTP